MFEAVKVLNKLDKTNKLVNLSLRKNGPKSYKRGQGALLAALSQDDGATQRELSVVLGLNRKDLKDVVKKAERNGYVTIEAHEDPKTYCVKLTEEGAKLAEKRENAHAAVAAEALACLSEEEIAALDAICEKIIVSAKENGIDAKKKGRKPRRHGRKHCSKHCRH